MVKTNNTIWNLPKLRYCNLKESRVNDSWFYQIDFLLFSIEYVSILNIDSYSIILHYLFKIATRLRQLNINDSCQSKSDRLKITSSCLHTLVTSFVDTDILSLLKFLRGMPNPCNLTFFQR